ncbi:hypothetical protein AY601_2932 [Pedobacter cryoconitis]|uniref:Uncharacterized protein n=1 Tax=Pedobacter cryoconitis TaxID=188932 RepID=A0A127VEZ6_9SPHI|nr:hypothetical protein AY601_2932 [Pedobacter cryoconitis]
MNLKFKISQWVDEVLHPKTLIKNEINKEDLVKLENGFLNQLKNYTEWAFNGTVLSRRHTAVHLRLLVNLSNTIYGYLFCLTSASKHKKTSSELRLIYLNILNALEKTIAAVAQSEPKVGSKMPLTRYHYSGLKMEIKTIIKNSLNILKRSPIEKKLYDLIEREFFLFINKKEINQYEIDYTWNLSRQIANLDLADTSDLIDILFINEFNSRIFFDFYSNELNSKLKDIPNLHDQLLTIIAEQDRFNGLAGSTIKMYPCHASTYDHFKTFLANKERHLKQLINLRRVVSQDEQFSKSTHRLKIFLSVAQLGLFIRLFVEKGLLAKENIGDQFTFFASHFSTPQAPFISAESLRKKSTDVEFATAQKLKTHLIGMLNWLNENYNLSNYKGS